MIQFVDLANPLSLIDLTNEPENWKSISRTRAQVRHCQYPMLSDTECKTPLTARAIVNIWVKPWLFRCHSDKYWLLERQDGVREVRDESCHGHESPPPPFSNLCTKIKSKIRTGCQLDLDSRSWIMCEFFPYRIYSSCCCDHHWRTLRSPNHTRTQRTPRKSKPDHLVGGGCLLAKVRTISLPQASSSHKTAADWNPPGN